MCIYRRKTLGTIFRNDLSVNQKGSQGAELVSMSFVRACMRVSVLSQGIYQDDLSVNQEGRQAIEQYIIDRKVSCFLLFFSPLPSVKGNISSAFVFDQLPRSTDLARVFFPPKSGRYFSESVVFWRSGI